MRVALKDIEINERARKNMGQLDELVASLNANGQITPITVRPPRKNEGEKGPWVLVAGGRRTMAAALAGWEEIEAYNFGDLPPLEQHILELEENLQRKEMEWHEIEEARAKIHALRVHQAAEAGKKWTAKDTAAELKVDPASMSRAIKTAEAIQKDPSLKNAGSSKAVARIMDLRQQLEIRERQAATGALGIRSRLVCGDSREWLRTLAPQSIDLILTDPPYAIDVNDSIDKSSAGTGGTTSHFDDSEEATKDLLTDAIPQMFRVLKDSGWLVITTSESLYDWLKRTVEDCCQTHGEYRIPREKKCAGTLRDGPNKNVACQYVEVETPRWIWHRPNSMNPSRLPERHAQNAYEHILVANMGNGRMTKKGTNVLTFDAIYHDRIHINQKPLELARELVERFTLTNELVCDPFFGSGALLAGAASLNRRITGCELNPDVMEQALGYVAQYYQNEVILETANA